MSTNRSLRMASLVVPMLNESGYIERCLESLAAQTVGTEHLDVIVADGGSTDGSRQWVDSYAKEHPWVRVVDNPRRKASAAFNIGMDEARGEVFGLFSSHGEAAPDFIERSFEVLCESGAGGVGGRCPHEGGDPWGQAIGLAMMSPFGMASPTRNVTTRRDVDTIIHPLYWTELARAVGHFDERLERNSDYEFNYRMRQAGHRLVADPGIRSVYRPRGSLRALGRQFWHYGRWKSRVIRQHPGSVKARHLVPPAAVAGVALSPAVARTLTGRRLLALGAVGYLSAALAAARATRPQDHHTTVGRVAACFPVMHFMWGAGLLASTVEDFVRKGEQ
ncbi:MAG: glycosyltransferase family 2 protein [Microthrixaceae bacterium]|nr:glycosyltransferase family 2 protein [Microthrixaceae bacterium]